MKTNNSILKGKEPMPSNYGMKLLLIPCLIVMLSLSGFRSKEVQRVSPNMKSVKENKMFTDPYVQTAVEVVFTDLDGTEYQDVWVDFFDENYYPVTVYNVTLNYQLSVSPTNYTYNTSQVLTGNSFFLLEDNVIYYTPPGPYGMYYSYNLLPGTGYIVH